MKRRIWSAVFAALGMLMLILDTNAALRGAVQGIELCLGVVVPSLLPFFVLSMLLTSCLNGTNLRLLRPLGRLCGIPAGAESLLMVGLMGGYPVGAQAVAAAYRDGQLSEATAKRLLGFCSNAGPAFIFGIVACKFSEFWIPWALWGIHIISSLAVGCILPGKKSEEIQLLRNAPVSMPLALRSSISVLSTVCGWIILFRVIIAFLQRWIMWLLPDAGQITLIGLLELSNGCCELELIENTGLRLVICSGLLAFGGLCVTMQTASTCGTLGLGMYLPGKLMQTVISTLLAYLVQLTLPDEHRILIPAALIFLIPGTLTLFAVILKKRVAFAGSIVYNRGKREMRV